MRRKRAGRGDVYQSNSEVRQWRSWPSSEAFVEDQLRVTVDNVVLQLADEFVTVTAVELLGPGVERRDEQKQVSAIAEMHIGESHQLRSHIATLCLGANCNTGDIGRTREP